MTKAEREKKVIKMMVEIYCHRHHSTPRGSLCEDCANLLEYSLKRIDRCPHMSDKKSCRRCPTHCYGLKQREEIRAVMRYVGPRMIFIHPVAAMRHLIAEIS